jgi:hypothetical protein
VTRSDLSQDPRACRSYTSLGTADGTEPGLFADLGYATLKHVRFTSVLGGVFAKAAHASRGFIIKRRSTWVVTRAAP